ncbi:MAG TPA: hypothetical protein VLA72_14100 [Anaerolineales bacterium]|nr:hypothetical protein [Anaerolineales bacterium]
MKKNFRILLAVTVLTLAALACQAVTGVGDEPNIDVPEIDIPNVEIPEIDVPEISIGNVIMSDDFSSDQWGTGTDAESAVEYVGSVLNFDVYTENYFVWSTPDDEVYSDIHMEVTAINNDTDSTTAFGFICNKSTGNDFYYFAMTPAGQYAIAEATDGETDVFLTNNDEWADSDQIAVNALSYRVGADCGNGRLTLYVDGVEIDSVSDSTYTSGRVALFVWSGDDVGITTNVSFDDFEMIELP